MVYLLINHVPFGNGQSPGRFRVGDLFLQDLCAQAKAIQEVGGRLIVATPCVENLSAMSGGSFNTVEANPEECGFEYQPLPRYLSLKQFLNVRSTLRARLHNVISRSDIVQMDYGGYPFMLGQVAWPIASALNKKRIWLFDGADPFPRLQLLASQETNPIKRWVKQFSVRRKIQFCKEAIQQADLVFAHNAAVGERFQAVWNDRCHSFDRSFVTEEILLNDMAARREYLLQAGRPIRLVCAGRQIAIKGTDHVIQAVASLREQGQAVELNVMGDGDDLPAFRALAESLKLGIAVRFSGTVPYGPELFDVWNQADVMLVTNLTAEISRNVLLSLARGLPLLTYANPGTDALLKENNAAVIVPKGDIAALAAAITDLSIHRQKLVDLAERGLRLARVKTLEATHRKRAELAAGVVGN